MAGFLILGLIIPLVIAIWVGIDAKKRGYSSATAFLWFLGVWLVLIVFLPLYLILRSRRSSPPLNERDVGVCPYCGRLFKDSPNFCPYCGERLR